MNHVSNYVPIKQNDISNFVNRKMSHQPKTHFPGNNKILLKKNNNLPVTLITQHAKTICAVANAIFKATGKHLRKRRPVGE